MAEIQERPKIQKRYFVGKNKPGIWASVYAYKPSDAKILAKRGEIFAAVVLKGPKDFDSSIAGNLLLDILHEAYFESTENSTLEALESAVKTTQNRLLSLVENDESAAINGIEFDLVALVIRDNYFFSVRVGDGVLKIYREGNLQDLAAGFRDPTGEKKIETLSSLTNKGDVFFLSSPDVLEAYTDEEILEAADEFSEIGVKNKMLEDDSQIAMLFVGNDINLKSDDKAKEMVGIDPRIQEKIEEENIQPKEVESAGTGDLDSSMGITDPEDESIEPFTQKRKTVDSVKQSVESLVNKVKRQLKSKRKSVALGDPAESIEEAPTGKPDSTKTTMQVYISSFFTKSKKIIKAIYQFIKEDILAIESKGVYLKKGQKNEINYRVVVAAIIILVLIFFFGMRMRRSALDQARVKRDNEKLVEDLQTEIDEISGSSVFTIDSPDNIAARQTLFNKIKELEDDIDGTEIADEYADKLGSYSSQLGELKDSVLRLIDTSPELVTDLGATFEGANPSDITISGGKIFVSDYARSVIYEINPNGGEKEFVNSEIQNPRIISADPDGGIVLVDESSNALGLINNQTGKITRFVGMTQEQYATAVEMEVYKLNDNDIRLYMAMSAAPQVQQVNKRSGYYSDGPQSRWSGNEYTNLSDIDLLDGKFFVIREGEGLKRMYVDVPISTTISGLLKGDNLKGVTKLTVDSLYIYVADPAKKRILVFTKSRGENIEFLDLVAQYKYRGEENIFTDVKDIEVDAENIYVLDGARVYKLSKSDFKSYTF